MPIFRSSKYAWAVAVGLALGLLVLLGSNKRLGLAACFICPTCSVALVASIDLRERASARRHARFVEQWTLDVLAQAGFRVERKGAYHGLKGTHQGYVVRAYHDPMGLSQRYSEDLCVLVYYTPPRRVDGNWDIARIRKLQDELPRYKWITLDPFIVEYGLRYLCGRTPARWRPRWGDVLWEIDRVVELARSHGLEPLDEEAVDHAVEKEPWNNGPPINTFQGREI